MGNEKRNPPSEKALLGSPYSKRPQTNVRQASQLLDHMTCEMHVAKQAQHDSGVERRRWTYGAWRPKWKFFLRRMGWGIWLESLAPLSPVQIDNGEQIVLQYLRT